MLPEPKNLTFSFPPAGFGRNVFAEAAQEEAPKVKGQKCGATHLRPYVSVKFMLRWQQDGSGKEQWRLLAAT